MKDHLVSLAKSVKLGFTIIGLTTLVYMLCQMLAPAFPVVMAIAGLVLLFGWLLVMQGVGQWAISTFDNRFKRADFKSRCTYLWAHEAPPLCDHTNDWIMHGLVHQDLPVDASGRCWSFGIDTSGYPGYEARGYLLVVGAMVHFAVVAGVRGKWHIDSYCRASCSVEGSVFTVESICGPLTGWVGVGAKLGVDLSHAGDEGLRGGPFGYVQLASSGVPQVLKRFCLGATHPGEIQ